jgi:hypothetical protein
MHGGWETHRILIRHSAERRKPDMEDNIKMYLFCGIFNDAISISGYITSNGRMIDELERISKEVAVT